MRDLFKMFRKSESGATLVEYGVALIVAIVVGGVFLTQLADATGVNMDAACDSLDPGSSASLTYDCSAL